jgi:hypothetical protein
MDEGYIPHPRFKILLPRGGDASGLNPADAGAITRIEILMA